MTASNPEPNQSHAREPDGPSDRPRAQAVHPSRSATIRSAPAVTAPRWFDWRLAAYGIAVAVALLLAGTISPRRLVGYQALLPLLGFIALAGGANAALVPVIARLKVAPGCLAFGIAALLMNFLLALIAARMGVRMVISSWGMLMVTALLTLASGLVFSLFDERDAEKAEHHAER